MGQCGFRGRSSPLSVPEFSTMADNSRQRRKLQRENLQRRNVGARGEDEAAEYFLDRGYTLLDRNFFTARGEVDIVLAAPVPPPAGASAVHTPTTVVFVEVKWRLDDRYGRGAEAVTRAKLAAMRYAATRWLEEHPEHHAEHIRFDVLDITDNEVTHYEGVDW